MSQSPFSPEQVAQLEQALDPKRVKHRAGGGGTQLAYLKGHDVIDTANKIFGYGNWGYDLLGVELNTIPGDSGEVVGSYYAARVRLSVAGCMPITEEGVCAVQEGRNPRAKIDSHDMARKGAITDALKRALRCYGDQFGNSLYDTDLVDGQPRVNGNGNGANRPLNRVQPNTAPVAERPVRMDGPEAAPTTFANGPVPVRTSVPATQGEGATEQQRLAILKLAAKQNLTGPDLQARLHGLYGASLDTLGQADARDFIKRMQQSAA